MMIRLHGEDRTLLSWLVTQEKVLRLWIDEALSREISGGDLVAELETHRCWLAAQIERLNHQHTVR
jgi:hypothetical protein